jgi:hypothetical protein
MCCLGVPAVFENQTDHTQTNWFDRMSCISFFSDLLTVISYVLMTTHVLQTVFFLFWRFVLNVIIYVSWECMATGLLYRFLVASIIEQIVWKNCQQVNHYMKKQMNKSQNYTTSKNTKPSVYRAHCYHNCVVFHMVLFHRTVNDMY